jgi:putative heme-binding domain-containing protein
MKLMLTAVCLLCVFQSPVSQVNADEPAKDVFRRDNLVAWCIVPFDDRDRSPEDRAAMLSRIGINKLAYDYRAKHIPTFDDEMMALGKHGIELTSWWFPGALNDEARLILDVLKRHNVKTQLWVTGGGEPTTSEADQKSRVIAEAARIRPIAEAAAEIGCTVGLYNHGGWFGEPENQIAVIRELNLPNVGIVYNQHHGHSHVDRFAELLQKMKPYLLCLNLNGMVAEGDAAGQKIVPLGYGALDLKLLRIIRESGYTGPIGILNHTQRDAEARLLDNMDGLKWLTRQLDGAPESDPPQLRSVDQPQQKQSAAPQVNLPYSTQLVADLIGSATTRGDAARGALVFSSPKFACLSCHRIGEHGGSLGPDLTKTLPQRSVVELSESFLWPQRNVPHEWQAWSVVTVDGRQHRGYIVSQDDTELVLKDPAVTQEKTILRSDIEDVVSAGSLMPDGLAVAMTQQQRTDVMRLLIDTRSSAGTAAEVSTISGILANAVLHAHAPATFEFTAAPIDPSLWPNANHHVNRDRLYEFYRKQALHFRDVNPRPPVLTQFPGLDGGEQGHWGNHDDTVWADGRWNQVDIGSLQCGVLHGDGVTVARGVCLRIGDSKQLSACFNPDTLNWEAVWTDGFLKFSPVRHGFVGGIIVDGTLTAVPEPLDWSQVTGDTKIADASIEYRGFVRYGSSTAIVYRVDGRDVLELPTVKDGQLVRRLEVRSPDSLPLTAQWPEIMETQIRLGNQSPYAIDTIDLPWENPWNALIFPGGHAFLPDGSALICSMQGDVWRVSEIEHPSTRAKWRRFASGLHHAQGIVVDDRGIFVLGRNQITRLHDLNDDGEADFYECFSKAFVTSTGGHDFICGLKCDAQGRFYTASGNQGLLRISADGKYADVMATGFRNPDGLGVLADASGGSIITVPCSEGEWTPASMICAIRAPAEQSRSVDASFFGFRGPRDGKPPALPLVYLPRGIDNSAGGQCVVDNDRWGPLQGQMLHFSFGTGTHQLLILDEVDGQFQGAIVPLPGEFRSGAHRGGFNPSDGQLYVSGMQGWGTYAVDDGSFERVRYVGEAVQLPVGWRAHSNGVTVRFSEPLAEAVAEDVNRHFAQCWNYRYGPGYGSPEFAPSHFGSMGHETLKIRSAHVLDDGHTLFLEIPDLQPVNQLHLLIDTGGRDVEMFATVHKLDQPFTQFSGYQQTPKEMRPHPIVMDLDLLTKSVPNPWEKRIKDARPITIDAPGNLSFATREITVTSGEALQFTFNNSDVVPHNWALARPNTLSTVGALCNRLIADPDAVFRHYIPDTDDVLVWTDIVSPKSNQTIWFRAPSEPGRYPFLCTFPGHWPVMNGVMIVE